MEARIRLTGFSLSEEYHADRYQERLLTTRQYAFARRVRRTVANTEANSGGEEAMIGVPVPLSAAKAENLMDGTIIPVRNGRLNLTLPGNSGVVLKIREV
ncbi:MAG: hypothetical protein LUE65_09100 [Clostridiales bacterium]|nr:hypothetical protein [Clostridiales bacterium]